MRRDIGVISLGIVSIPRAITRKTTIRFMPVPKGCDGGHFLFNWISLEVLNPGFLSLKRIAKLEQHPSRYAVDLQIFQ